MSSCIILAQSEPTSAALKAWAQLLDAPAFKEHIEHSQDKLEIFDRVAPIIAGILADAGQATILVDAVRWNGLDPLGTGWDSSLASLILAFPEVRWIFGADRETRNAETTAYQLCALLSNSAPDPLMDGYGLREHIRRLARQNASKTATYLPERRCWAAALDDEKSYAYFDAYTAYRFGLRAFPIRHSRTADLLFAQKGNVTAVAGDLSVTFEDIFLNFPDRENNVHYSDLARDRAKTFEGLVLSDWRVFVSSSQTQVGTDDRRKRNRDYIQTGAGARSGAREVRKPLSGMFDLWQKSGLERTLAWSYFRSDGKELKIRGRGDRFLWPPPLEKLGEEDTTGHGSPGTLLMIAEHLIQRANGLMDSGVRSVADAVRGAVLATDALELLGDRTPTTAIEALGLKHRFEMLAECQFSGVEYHLQIQERLSEIKTETQILAGWFHPDGAKGAGMNAEMFILNHLVRILREYNQFDEEQTCMARVRHLHNHLQARTQPLLLRIILQPLMAYLGFLLRSFPRFAISLSLWIVGLGLLHWAVGAQSPSAGIGDAYVSFFGIQPSGDDHLWAPGNNLWSKGFAVVALTIASGFVHLGVFIAHLYTLVSRK